MVHKTTSRPRGRPRAYDPDEALGRAMASFWERGFAGTSLDQLSDATCMNRPSLYAAFGDKRALYLQTLERYVSNSKAGIERALAYDIPLEAGLRRLYEGALVLYCPVGDAQRGCYLTGTAVTEAVQDEAVRSRLGAALRGQHAIIEARLRHAASQGQIDAAVDTAAMATVASAVLYTLSIRARAGESRASLRAAAEAVIRLICGAKRTTAGAARTPTRSRKKGTSRTSGRSG